MTNRRAFLKVAFGSSAVILLAACAPAAPAAKPTEAPKPAEAAKPAESKPAAPAATAAPAAAAKPTEVAKPAEAAKPAAAAPAAAAKPAGVPGGKLTVAYVPAATHIDVNSVNISTVNEVAHYFYETLFDRGADGKLQPLLVDQEQVAQDGLTVTWKLRSDVKFHDGTPFNAAAVKWNLERKLNKKQPLADLLPIKTIETPDEGTVKLSLSRPSAGMNNYLSTKTFSMYSPTHAEKVGDDGLKSTAVGTGAYTLVELKPNEAVLLKKNPDYWQKGLPYLDEVTFRMVPNISTRAALLESGEVDMALGIALPDVGRLKSARGLKAVEGLGSQQYGLTMNNKREPFTDVKVRQAVNYAVDKEGIIKTVMLGNAKAATGVYLNPNINGYVNAGSYPYDQAKAKALLDEAGWKVGANGIREKNGKPLAFTLMTRRGANPGDYEMAELVQAMLKAVGMDLNLEVVESAIYLTRLNKPGEADYDMTSSTFGVFPGDAEYVMETVYRSDAVPPRYYNYAWYSNPQVDKLVEDARSSVTLADRNKLYEQAAKIVVEDAGFVLLFDVQQVSIMKEDVQGVYLEPCGNNFPGKYAWRGKA
jgi:ABC-type transport system substrate-binding protein